MTFVKDILSIFFKKGVFFNKIDIQKIRLSIFLYFIISILELLSLGFLIVIVLSLLDFQNDLFRNFEFLKNFEKKNILLFFLFLITLKYLAQIFLYYFEKKIYRNLQNSFLSSLIINYFYSTNDNYYHNINHSSIISNIVVEVRAVFISFFRPASDFFSESIIIIFLVIFLIFLSGPTVFFAFLVALILLFIFLKKLSKLANKWGRKRVATNSELVSFIGGLLNNLSLIKIFHKESYFTTQIQSLYFIVTNAEFLEDLGQKLFRIILEAFIIFIFILFLYHLLNKGNSNEILTNIIAIFIPFLRVVPAFLKINTSLNKMLYAYPSVIELKKNADNFSQYNHKDLIPSETINFNDEIKINNVFFGYDQNNFVLKNLNLNFKKNQKYLIIGVSGSGKTTLGEILMGLRKANSGEFKVDKLNFNPFEDYKWKNLFSYVPQDIFLLNTSIKNNIAFGEYKENINEIKIRESLINMNMSDIDMNLQIKNFGKNLSGGQKQRIGICRALYFDKEIIIMDEPTSALNNFDSVKIIEDILKLNKTIIVISHDKNITPYFKNIINLNKL
jgi:ABC-type bacteriocin/lantibiotic exporter with double-glycine peptidase domain